ncbi:terminase [Candidatus Pacearchaeota archaeon]|nr:terminase [Candidatus Pacearchaeota archaeon]
MLNTSIDQLPAKLGEWSQEQLCRQNARRSLLSFCEYTHSRYRTAWHLEQLADRLESIERGETKRLIVVMPPQHGKSEMISVRFPAWFLGRNDNKSIVQASYAESLALFHSRQARDILVSSEYQNIFPDIVHRPQTEGQTAIVPVRQSATEWGTRTGGSYYAVGVGGGLTGRGFDIGIIDDPVKDAAEAASPTYRDNVWNWYSMVFRTRLRPDAAIIIVMTRWHQDDLVGRLLQLSAENADVEQWDVIHFEAIKDGRALWPDRYPLDVLLKIRAVSDRNFEALFQGSPTLAEGNIFKREWWKHYRVRPEFKRLIQSWDTAFKKGQSNDPSVCGLWGEADDGFYLIDVWRDRVEFPELRNAAIAAYNRDHPDVVLVEDAASGQSLLQALRRETLIPLKAVRPDKDKEARANAITPLIESGRVFLPEHAAWLHDYMEELSSFPNGEHDDQVDSTTQALRYLAGRPEKLVSFV